MQQGEKSVQIANCFEGRLISKNLPLNKVSNFKSYYKLGKCELRRDCAKL